MIPQKIAWELRYDDDSGVQYAVRFDSVDLHYDGCARVEVFAGSSASQFPITKLSWLIACLREINDMAFDGKN
jgi:hypothetical protein